MYDPIMDEGRVVVGEDGSKLPAGVCPAGVVPSRDCVITFNVQFCIASRLNNSTTSRKNGKGIIFQKL
jgi:hypothetical protein